VSGCVVIALTNWEPTTIILPIMFVLIKKAPAALETLIRVNNIHVARHPKREYVAESSS